MAGPGSSNGSLAHDEEYGQATARFYDAAYARLPLPQRDGRDVAFYRELARDIFFLPVGYTVARKF